MKDALSLADEIVQGGEGDLTSMGEFADVEYKVSSHDLYSGLEGGG